MHSQGLGVPRDPRRAAELWKRAAENDYSLAQYNLALAYFRGEGVARNELR
jgi:TPR repeat protein